MLQLFADHAMHCSQSPNYVKELYKAYVTRASELSNDDTRKSNGGLIGRI